MKKRRAKLRRKTIKNEKIKRPSHVISIPVRQKLTGPFNAVSARWPDAKERALLWRGKTPPFDELARRRTYDVNKKLADDLGRDVAVVIGCPYIRTSSHLLFSRKMKKRR